MKQFLLPRAPKPGAEDKIIVFIRRSSPLLAARAATDPDAARLLEVFTKADEIVSEPSLEGIGDVEISEL